MWLRPLALLAFGGATAALAGALWFAAFLTSAGGRIDRAVFAALTDAGAFPLKPRIYDVTWLADPMPFVGIAAVLVAWALLRRRPALAAIVVAILAAANVATQGLKIVIPKLVDRAGVDAGYELAWPSGHSTGAMSLTLCAVLVASPRLRPAVATLGAAYSVAVGYGMVAVGSHLPSDVLGGYLVAACFSLLGVAALHRLRATPVADKPQGRVATPIAAPAIGALAVVAAAAAAVLAKTPDPEGLLDHAPAMVAAASIAGLGVTLIAGLAFIVRR